MNNSHISYTKNVNLSHPLLPKKLISHISYNSKLCGSHIFVLKFENNTKISFLMKHFSFSPSFSTFIGVMDKPTNNPPFLPIYHYRKLSFSKNLLSASGEQTFARQNTIFWMLQTHCHARAHRVTAMKIYVSKKFLPHKMKKFFVSLKCSAQASKTRYDMYCRKCDCLLF